MKLRLRRKCRTEPIPRHPVTVSVSLDTGAVVIEGLDVQIERITEELGKAGIVLSVEARGLCG